MTWLLVIQAALQAAQQFLQLLHSVATDAPPAVAQAHKAALAQTLRDLGDHVEKA